MRFIHAVCFAVGFWIGSRAFRPRPLTGRELRERLAEVNKTVQPTEEMMTRLR